MTIAYLNGKFLPLEEARISPMDRGFLFGDGIYEVIPSYGGKMVGFSPHIARLQTGLDAIEIKHGWSDEQWKELCTSLLEKNGNGNLGVYLHVTRGADTKRNHAYPEGIKPTVFGYAFEIPPPPIPDRDKIKPFTCATGLDMRWDRCNIKSISLLGNVLHYQQGHSKGDGEILLYNGNNELTECGACNAYIVKNGVVATPPLDNQILPGITRLLLLSVLATDGSIPVEERVITMDEVWDADEVWISSSSKEVVPVVKLDGKPVGDGKPGPIWEKAAKLYSAGKYNF
ncbi:MAG TPA: D-amino acid aminotransferase [Gammaproteobacteria bacterium]|nr:D-amino acid aminotransferase [Gammaproteobacteria bacterium]